MKSRRGPNDISHVLILELIDHIGALVLRIRHQEGQTMAEYAILIAVIALVVIVAAVLLGANTSSILKSTAGKL